MDEQNSQDRKGVEGENLRHSIGLKKQLNVKYDWQGGEQY